MLSLFFSNGKPASYYQQLQLQWRWLMTRHEVALPHQPWEVSLRFEILAELSPLLKHRARLLLQNYLTCVDAQLLGDAADCSDVWRFWSHHVR